jgi:hypothetical protein
MSLRRTLATAGDEVVYSHTQHSRFMPLLAAGTLLSGGIGYFTMNGSRASRAALFGVCAASAAAVADCSTLRVRVTRDTLAVRFHFGWPSRVVRRSDIVSVGKGRPSPASGWGFRWLGPGKIMFRVDGLDAVHARLRDGRVFFVGTDDPDGLLAALE